MKTKISKWFEVTIRYYNPAIGPGMTTETIALEADSFTDAENRTRDLYSGFNLCEILGIFPALYEDVLFSESFYAEMHWYLVTLEEDEEMLDEYYEYLKDSGCNCPFLRSCNYSNGKCSHTTFSGSACSKETPVLSADTCPCCSHEASVSGYNDFLPHHSNTRTIQYTNAPSCFSYAGPLSHKAFILVQGSDFSHVLKRVKEYMHEGVLDYNIFAIQQTQLCDVILRDRCQL